jgi:hypothetical protein
MRSLLTVEVDLGAPATKGRRVLIGAPAKGGRQGQVIVPRRTLADLSLAQLRYYVDVGMPVVANTFAMHPSRPG